MAARPHAPKARARQISAEPAWRRQCRACFYFLGGRLAGQLSLRLQPLPWPPLTQGSLRNGIPGVYWHKGASTKAFAAAAILKYREAWSECAGGAAGFTIYSATVHPALGNPAFGSFVCIV